MATTHDYKLFRIKLEEYTGQPHRTVIRDMVPCDASAAAADERFSGTSDDFAYKCVCGHPIMYPNGFRYIDPKGHDYPFLIGSVCIKGFVKDDPDLSEALTLTVYNRCLKEGCRALLDKEKKVKNECVKFYCPQHRIGHGSIECTRCGQKTPFERPKITTCPECYLQECRKKRNRKLLQPGERGCEECGRVVRGQYNSCYACNFPATCKCGKKIRAQYKTCFGCR
jgi:hypothetical protein